ncbi:J domain-containing protein (plasmid) [Paroceanicella profunda]|uniref:J domain-containing protein n=1 Tax=Paroceanicella profunda TaxID=2579971 RepID=A0A5B8G532_9RHOB|nr:DnaJ C-terminal domain-containing protein [Paroceanicella profunda]QDL94402.1 J domain-containing protein [Paroceanicella profunda]
MATKDTDDPYALLGVARDASPEDIRKAYRRQVKKHHPDLHPGDAGAEARFKAIAAANEILSDPDKRARFDRGELDAAGHETGRSGFWRDHAGSADAGAYRSSAGFDDFAGASDFFSDIFGRRAGAREGGGMKMRGSDMHYRVEVDFRTAARGGKIRLSNAEGAGFDLSVPEGCEEGQVIRLAGLGRPGSGGGPSGDALVSVSIRPDPLFRREGRDILIEVPVSIDEVVTGARIDVPTLDGTVKLTIPKGAGAKVLRLRGKGVHPGGDQLVRLRIVAPEAVDDALVAALEAWRARARPDPRRNWGGAR